MELHQRKINIFYRIVKNKRYSGWSFYIVKKSSTHTPVGRRHFLSTTAMIGSSLVLSSGAIAQSSANNSLNVAVLGAGAQGQELINTCMKMEGVRVKALCDIWESYNLNRTSQILTGFKQEHTRYTDYREMLEKEKDLQAVIIATPDFCHAEQTVACLNAGLNVYCESLMSNTLDGAKSMVQTARSTGKLLQIGHQRRSNPRYLYSYDHIVNETKMLGKITALNGQWNRAVQPDRGWPRRAILDDASLSKYGFSSMQQFRNWEWYKALGCGPLASLGAHQIDVFNWFMGGFPKTVMASGGTEFYDPATHEWFDTVMVIFEYEYAKQNVRAFYQTINSNSNFGYFENLMGDQGTLYLSESSGRVKVYREPSAPDWEKWVKIGILESAVKEPKKEAAKEPAKDSGQDAENKAEGDAVKKSDAVIDVKETVIPPSYDLPVKFDNPLCLPHLQNFFQAIRGSEALRCPAETAYPATLIVLKINEAIQSGQRIELKPEDFQV